MKWNRTAVTALAVAWLASPCVASAQEVTSNNLSYPGVFTGDAVTLPGAEGLYSLEATFGGGMSYGCDVPQVIGTSAYPNTSCVDLLSGALLDADACVAQGAPCEGVSALDRIYWQQTTENVWQAEWLSGAGTVVATQVDWGDNLETVTWSERSIIRVETTPFATLDATQRGFQMWHVADQGPDEMWGVRANADGAPYVYDSPYAIINAGSAARLNIAKISAAADCPTAAGGAGSGFLGSWTGAGWAPGTNERVVQVLDQVYGAELNIGGKFVYGYNWNLKKAASPGDLGKTGWWRLTFYTNGAVIDFPSAQIPLAPPVLPSALLLPVAEAETDTGSLYVPRVDPERDITWIDICIGSTRGSGSGGGGGSGMGGR